MGEIYEPEAYFERLGAEPRTTTPMPFAPARARYWRRHPMARLKGQARNLARAARALCPADAPRRERGATAPVSRGSAGVSSAGSGIRRQIFGYLIRCAMHYHHVTLAADMAQRRGAVVNSF